MKKQDRIFKLSLTVLILIFISLVIFIQKQRLDKPFFLKVYLEREVMLSEDAYATNPFELKYITNNNDQRFITVFSFIDTAEHKYPMRMESIATSETGLYRQTNIFVDFFLDAPIFESGKIEIQSAHLLYSDGSSEIIDIGNLILYEEDTDQMFLEEVSSKGDNTGEVSTTYRIKRDFTLYGFEDINPSNNAHYDITINGNGIEDSLNETFSRGSEFTLKSIPKKQSQRLGINPSFKLKIKDKNEESHNVYLSLNHYLQENIDYFKLREYIQKEREQ